MKLPRLKASVDVYLEGEDLHFLFANSGLQKTFEADPLLVEMIQLLDGRHSPESLWNELRQQKSTLTVDDIISCLELLEDEQIIEEATTTGDLNSRYRRQLEFWQEFVTGPDQPSPQDRLQMATATVIGLGGTGSWVAKLLTMAGVGRLRLCDFDAVETSNLTRQAVYTTSDIGRRKVDVACERLTAINPEVEIEGYNLHLTGETDLNPVIQGASVVINCTDTPSTTETGMWVAQACMPARIPHIVGGGYHGHLGMIGPTILPYESACWECITAAKAKEYAGWKPVRPQGHTGRMGSLGPLAAIIASIHAWEAIRVLTGVLPPRMVNRTGEFRFDTLEPSFFDYARNPQCAMCGQNGVNEHG